MKQALDLGCGMRKRPDDWETHWMGVDIRNFDGVDYVLNLGMDTLPFADNSIDRIQSIHLFEHFTPEQLFFCMEECWRVLKPEGYIHIEVPKAGTNAFYVHPDHKIQFTEITFGFFQVPANGFDPHGYLKHFWHVNVIKENVYEEHLHADLYPNKPNGRFEYKEIIS